MKDKTIEFVNSKGIKLSGKLELPADRSPKSYAIFAHCFTCSKNLNAVKHISRALTTNGFGVLRFDFTGLGQSGGDFASTNFTTNIEDLEDVANYMSKELGAPELLVGHSLGGAAVIFASARIQSIKSVATIGAPSSPQHVQHLFKTKIEEIKTNGISLVDIGGRSFHISAQFIEDISSSNMTKVLKSMEKPLLIMHSPQDKVVGIKNATEIYSFANHPKSFISLYGADHLLSKKEDSIYAGKVVAEWASRYINLNKEKTLKTTDQVVVKIGSKGLTTDILAGEHNLTADEPENVGGDNFGPSPYDLLLSSLGACTAMTLRLYANQKKWNLEEVIIHLSHGKTYIKDCQNSDEKSAKVDRIEKRIVLIGNLDHSQKQRLLEIANKCPVHKSLNNEIIIDSQLQNE